MSATSDARHDVRDADRAGQRARAEAEPDRCAQCGMQLAEDQEWCLHCGASRTLIYTPPDWRVPVAVVSLVALLAVAGAVFAVVRLSDDAGRTAAEHASQAQAPRVAPALSHAGHPGRTAPRRRAGTTTGSAAPTRSTASTSSTATTTTTSAGGHAIASWPVGLSGWTVVLAKYATEAEAYARARQIAPTGLPVGVLDSSQHPALQPGLWLVFSSRYPDRGAARAAVFHLIASGYGSARARQVAAPGGL